MRCLECDETLCDECVVAHFRVRITRQHSLIKIMQPQQAFINESQVFLILYLFLTKIYARNIFGFSNILYLKHLNQHSSRSLFSSLNTKLF